MLVKDIIDKHASIVADYEVITWESESASSRFKARITFIDGSALLIKDYLFAHGREIRISLAGQHRRAEDALGQCSPLETR